MAVWLLTPDRWTDVQHWSELTALLGGVSTGVIYFSKKVNVAGRLAAIVRFPARLSRTLDSVAAMEKELRPNGGGSIFDKVHTIANTSQEALLRLDAVEHHQALTMATLQIVVDEQGIIQFTADLNGDRTWVGGAWQAMTGLTADDSLGTGWVNAIDSEQRESVLAAWLDAVQARRPFFMTYYYSHAVTGERVPVRCEARPVKDGGTDIVGYVGTVRRARASDQQGRLSA